MEITILSKPITQMLCTCKDCQKSTGTGHAALALFPDAALKIEGESKSFDVIANSGAITSRHFCPNCGTGLFGKSSRFPHLTLVSVGFFDDNSWFSPNSVIFARSHNDWDEISAALPKYETYKGE